MSIPSKSAASHPSYKDKRVSAEVSDPFPRHLGPTRRRGAFSDHHSPRLKGEGFLPPVFDETDEVSLVEDAGSPDSPNSLYTDTDDSTTLTESPDGGHVFLTEEMFPQSLEEILLKGKEISDRYADASWVNQPPRTKEECLEMDIFHQRARCEGEHYFSPRSANFTDSKALQAQAILTANERDKRAYLLDIKPLVAKVVCSGCLNNKHCEMLASKYGMPLSEFVEWCGSSTD